MAKLPTIRRILREDVREAPAWIDPILNTMNTANEAVYSALNKNISFSENVACQLREIKFKTLESYPALEGSFDAEATTVSGSAIITNVDTSRIGKGTSVSGTGIPASATIAKILSPSSFKLSANATASGQATLIFTNSSSGIDSITFNNSLRTKAIGCTVEQIYEVADTYNIISKPVTVDWREINGTIYINHITGLEPSKTYIIRLMVK